MQFGTPVIKSLSFYDQCDPIARDRELEFLYGDNLLVAPVLKAKQKSLTVYLPTGEWLDYYSGKRYEGGKKHRVNLRADRLPLFAKAGAVIPHYPVQQHVHEKDIECVDLKVYFGQKGDGLLYEDAGEGYAYEKGGYRLSNFQTSYIDNCFSIRQERSGKFKPGYKLYQMEVFGLTFGVSKCLADGKEVPFEQTSNGTLQLRLKAKFECLELY